MFIDSLGAIKGTPTETKPLTNYVIIGENAFGSDTANVSFEVVGCSITGFNPFPDTLSICGTSTLLDAGPGFQMYIWNMQDSVEQITVSSSGEYNIWVVDQFGCEAYDSTFVSLVNASIIQSDTTICAEQKIELSINKYLNGSDSINSGLVAEYLLNGNGLDNSLNGFNATVSGATTPVLGKDGNTNGALGFTIAGWNLGSRLSEVYIPYDSVFKSPKFSISAWVKPTSYGYPGSQMTILNMYQEGYSNPNGQVYKLEIGDFDNSGRLTATVLGESASNTQQVVKNVSSVIPLNQWTHVVATFDGNNLSTYVNGQLSNTVSIPSGFVYNRKGTSGISIGVSNQVNGYWYPFDC
jgi:hypothetical protein